MDDRESGAADSQILRDAASASDLMVVDREHGERLFEQIIERYGEHGLVYYWRGLAHRASGRRKLALADFTRAVELLSHGQWRQRAIDAARRARSHHDPPLS